MDKFIYLQTFLDYYRDVTRETNNEGKDMTTKRFAYARVSSKEQNLQRQLDALTATDDAGAYKYLSSERDLFTDKASGKDFNRPQWQALMSQLREGDELTVLSLDRMSRDYEGLKDAWTELTRKGVKIRVLDMPMISTADKAAGDDLTAQLISDITINLLAYVAQQERSHIKERQAQGIASAKAKGIHCGRPSLELAGWDKVVARYKAKEITAKQAYTELGISKSSFFNKLKAQKGE